MTLFLLPSGACSRLALVAVEIKESQPGFYGQSVESLRGRGANVELIWSPSRHVRGINSVPCNA